MIACVSLGKAKLLVNGVGKLPRVNRNPYSAPLFDVSSKTSFFGSAVLMVSVGFSWLLTTLPYISLHSASFLRSFFS